MKKIGIVSCNKWKEKIQEDLLLKQALIESGFLADIISWEDTEINFNEYSCLILRSVWGYQDKYESFKKWLLFIKKSNIKIFNDVEILLNNIRKDVQFEILDRHSIPHISTMFIKQLHELELLENIKNDMVIKPIISGSGNNTYRISQLCNSAFENTIQVSNIISKFKPIFDMKDNGAMIQPYISEIKNGEFSCIFIDGVNTHNMLRFPGLFFEKKKPIYLNAVPEDVRKLANCVSKLQEYNNYLYMRIDIIYNNGNPTIMEVELAEPDLLTKYIIDDSKKKEIINQFAKKLIRRL